MAPRKSGKKGTPNPFPWLTDGKPCGPYAPTYPLRGLKVYCVTLDRTQIAALLAEFKSPDQKFRALVVKGSPFVSLSISPTKAAND